MSTVLSPCYTLYYVQSTQYCTKYIPFLSPAVSPYILHSHSFSIPQCFLLLNPSILLYPRMSPLSLFLFSVHTHWNSSLFLLIFPFNTFFKYFPNSFFSFHSFLFLHFLLYLLVLPILLRTFFKIWTSVMIHDLFLPISDKRVHLYPVTLAIFTGYRVGE